MSHQEVQELIGLTEWVSTFPQLEQFPFDNENASVQSSVVFLSNPNMASSIFDVALEVCNVGDADTVMGLSEDIWDTILSLTRRSISGSKRKVDESSSWNEFSKHVSLCNLLSLAVSHKNLLLRKEYIERIMTCSSSTQRLLMSLIERRKKTMPMLKTPSRSRNLASSSKKLSKDHWSPPKQTTSVAESLLASPTNHALTTPLREEAFNRGNHHTSTDASQSNNEFSPPSFQQRKSVYERGGKNSSASSTVEQQASNVGTGRNGTGNISSTSNILRRADSPSVVDAGRNLQQCFTSPPQQSANNSCLRTTSTSFRQGGNGIFSPGLGDTAEYETQVQNLRDENQEMLRELQKSRRKEAELSKTVDEMEMKCRQEVLKVEREARERVERSNEQYQANISQIQQELARVTEEFSLARKERDELAKLKDEMEVMKHAKSQLEDTTERLRNYKEKLQQLTDVKEALQREEEAHDRSVDENLRLKNELLSLQPLKRQLEEYKTKSVELEVQLTDCNDELAKLKEQKSSSFEINHQMEQYVLAQEEEIQELRRRLDQNDAVVKESSGVGDGMTELNPELKAEVLSLRNENIQLRAFAKKRDVDEVSKLEQEVEDKNMLAERYKTQFLSTKNQLEDTMISLDESKDRESKLQLEVEEKSRVAERYKSQYLNTKEQLESTQMSLQESKNRESKLRSELADSFAKLKETQQEVEDISNQLIKCTDDFNAGMSRESKLEEELSVWAGEAKSAHERANDLSCRLKKIHVELDESHNREIALLDQVTQYKQEKERLDDRLNDLSEQFNQQFVDLEKSRVREEILEKSIEEWTARAEESHEHAKNVTSQLMKSHQELETSREKIAELDATRLEESALRGEAEENLKHLQQKLDDTIKSLEVTFVNLKESKDNETRLKNEITDLLCRAEDAENVSKQRMELVQSTREKVLALEKAFAILEEEKKQLISEVTSLNETNQEAQQTNENLENELEEVRLFLNNTEERLSEVQALRDYLKAEVEMTTGENKELNDKLSSANDLTKRLQDELVETRSALNTTQSENDSLKEREILLNEKLEQVNLKTSDLEKTLNTETEIRKGVSAELEHMTLENTRLSDEMKQKEQILSAQTEAEREKNVKINSELSTVKESINAMQITLGSYQHREKMLKHEIAKLEDEQKEYAQKLADAGKEIEMTANQSTQSLESLRKVLTAKAQEDLADLQQNMSRLLEDERSAKRQHDETHKKEIQRLKETHQTQMKANTEKNETELQKYKTEYEAELSRIQGEYEQVRTDMEQSAQDEREKLIEKGKAMIEEIKSKLQKENEDLQDDVNFLTQKVMKEEDDKKRLGIQFQTKIVEYKKKLQAASARINVLSFENSDFEEKLVVLEREKLKLREENERYRRQIGGRSGSDSALQNQVEMLQNEFQNAIEENKALKKKLQNQGQNSMSSICEESDAEKYTSNRSSQQSTLSQLRVEYEETIDSLNSEKRDLIMKNSAAVTDVQKAEKRAWLVEQENAKLKQDLTSLKLSNERLETLLSSVEDGTENLGHISTYSNISLSEMSPIPQPPSDLGDESAIGEVATTSFRKGHSVLSTSRDNSNSALPSSKFGDKYTATGQEGLTSPEPATKRWVQSNNLHPPYRSRPIASNKFNDPPTS